MTTISDDEDLLILSDDDNNSDKLVIEDSSSNEDLELSNEELLTFDGLDLQDTDKSEETLEKNDFTTNSEDSLDLFSTTNIDNNSQEQKEETVFTAPILVSNNVSVWTMEDILSRAMSELDLRSQTIVNDKKNEESNIADLEKQIKLLEANVKLANEKVSALDLELAMIAKNEKALEKMKETNVVSETLPNKKNKY